MNWLFSELSEVINKRKDIDTISLSEYGTWVLMKRYPGYFLPYSCAYSSNINVNMRLWMFYMNYLRRV